MNRRYVVIKNSLVSTLALAVVLFFAGMSISVSSVLAEGPFPVAPWSKTHLKIHGVIDRIQGNVLFAKTPWGRWALGTTKQLKNLAVGDEVILYVNENNTLIDVHRKGAPGPHHRWLTGHLVYATPQKKSLRLWTNNGMENFPISPSALPKVTAIPEGSVVSVVTNEKGEIIDVDKIDLTVQVRKPYPTEGDHYLTVTGIVTQVESPLVILDTPFGEMSVANVVNIKDIRPGDQMVLQLTKDYTVVDMRRAGEETSAHRYLTGKLQYRTGNSIQLNTPEGVKEFQLSRKSQSGIFHLLPGEFITVELDADGRVVSVHKAEGQS